MKTSFLQIDPLRLDKEWLGQPELYYQHAENLANARREVDEAKAALDVVAAETDNDVRRRPERYKVDKVTESTVKAAVLRSSAYTAANTQYLEARHRMDVCQAVVTALEHRKRALTMLVELQGRNYFADPAVTATPEVRDAMAEKSKAHVRTRGRIARPAGLEDDEDGED